MSNLSSQGRSARAKELQKKAENKDFPKPNPATEPHLGGGGEPDELESMIQDQESSESDNGPESLPDNDYAEEFSVESEWGTEGEEDGEPESTHGTAPAPSLQPVDLLPAQQSIPPKSGAAPISGGATQVPFSGRDWPEPVLTHRQIKKPSFVPLVERAPRSFPDTLIIGGGAFAITTGLAWALFWQIPGLAPWPFSLQDPRMTGFMSVNLTVLTIKHYVLNWNTYKLYSWDTISAWLNQTGAFPRMAFINILSLVLGTVAGLFAGIQAGMGTPLERHVSGKKLFNTVLDARTGLSEELSVHGSGINIHPGVRISRDRETRHFFVLGAIGAGKTQILLSILRSILARFRTGPEDRMIIYDSKSDFTGGLPIPDDQLILLAPWDARTWAWDVGRDILNAVDAQTLATRLIPDGGKDPFWANATRTIVSSVIQLLQEGLGQDWSWKDLSLGLRSMEIISEAVLKYSPQTAPVLGIGQEGKGFGNTGANLLVNIAAFSAQVDMLCRAWDNTDPNTFTEIEPGRVIPRISLREWAFAPTVKRRVIVLQGNKRYFTLEMAYIQALVSAFGGIMNSPEMPDSKKRRIWLVLDEFPQLGKLDNFAQFLEVGRSKGLCVILGLQDLAQLREIYGRDTSEVWQAIAGTYIICRSQGVETVRWLTQFFGEREVKITTKTHTSGGDWTSREETRSRAVVSADDLETLGPVRTGIRAILGLGNSSGVYRLTWPYVTLPAVRPAQISAAWTSE